MKKPKRLYMYTGILVNHGDKLVYRLVNTITKIPPPPSSIMQLIAYSLTGVRATQASLTTLVNTSEKVYHIKTIRASTWYCFDTSAQST